MNQHKSNTTSDNNPSSLRDDLLLFFEQTQRKDLQSKLTSLFGRFIAPGLGFKVYEGKRMTPQYKEEMFQFLDTITNYSLTDLKTIFETLSQEQPKSSIKSDRASLKVFSEWAVKHKKARKPIESKGSKVIRRKRPHLRKDREKFSFKCASYRLMARHSADNPEKKGQLVYPEDFINDRLAIELENLEKYLYGAGQTESSVFDVIRTTMQYLGWLHRFKGVPLETISINDIITPVPLTIPKDLQSLDAILLTEVKLKRELNENASRNTSYIEEFLEWGRKKKLSSASKKVYLRAFVNIAKLQFREEIPKQEEYSEYSELPIAKKLHLLRKALPKEPVKVPYDKKTVSWEEALEVLEYLRSLHIADYHIEWNGSDKFKPKDSVRSRYLQEFLLLALCLLLPADRSRTYYELEIGRTFVFGIFKGNKFKPRDYLSEKGEWFVHLRAEDYKTGKTYGEFWSLPIPNYKFQDDTYFYSYITDWLSKYRDNEGEITHNLFFRQVENKECYSKNSWWDFVTSTFYSYTGVPVGSNSIRHMQSTHERNLGLSHEELKANAAGRHHSIETCDKYYNEQTQQQKLAPSAKANLKLNGSLVSVESNQD